MIENNNSILARIVSNVLHPLLMLSYGVGLLFVYTDFRYTLSGKFLYFMMPVVAFSLLIPAGCMFVLKHLNIISDYDVTDRRERLSPFFVILLAHCLLFYTFLKSGLYIWFLSVLAAPVVLLVIGMLITLRWKISAHMAGIGCLIGSIMSVSYNVKGINPFLLFIILFILAGCLAVSRLILKKHTPAQVYAGFLLGLTVSYICVWIGANFTYLYVLYITKFLM